MLGSASLGLAIVMVTVTFLGLIGMSFPPFSEPREVTVEATPRRFTTRIDRGQYVSEPVLVSAGRIFVPSSNCARLPFAGWLLGGIGITVSWRRRKCSWLSAIGVTLMLLAMMIVAGCDLFMTLLS
jgi:hypothetical protein